MFSSYTSLRKIFKHGDTRVIQFPTSKMNAKKETDGTPNDLDKVLNFTSWITFEFRVEALEEWGRIMLLFDKKWHPVLSNRRKNCRIDDVIRKSLVECT